jgi:HAMP domain-containing protein
MSDKPTEPTEGDMWSSLNAMWRQVNRQQEQIYNLRQEVEQLKAERRLENPRPLTGTIDGLEGQFTITPPPEWDA